MNWLFVSQGDSHPDVVVRADARRRLDLGPQGIVKELITPDTVPEVQVMRITFEPGAVFEGLTTAVSKAAKSGSVLSGQLRFDLDGKSFTLGAGDSFAFHANKPHKLICVGEQSAVVLWIVTPAIY